jgi:broad specificity phosphatase PhoE
MTTFFLIRHGNNDFVGKTLVGRTSGVHLNEEGRRQAENLARRLAGEPIRRIYSSPLERATETAAPLAKQLGLKVQISEAITEIEFGDWTNQHIADLESTDRRVAPLECVSQRRTRARRRDDDRSAGAHGARDAPVALRVSG